MKGKGNCYSLQAVLPCKAICLQTQNEREPKAELDDKALEIVLATMFVWEPQMFHIMHIGTKNPVQIYMCCDPEPFMWKCSPSSVVKRKLGLCLCFLSHIIYCFQYGEGNCFSMAMGEREKRGFPGGTFNHHSSWWRMLCCSSIIWMTHWQLIRKTFIICWRMGKITLCT